MKKTPVATHTLLYRPIHFKIITHLNHKYYRKKSKEKVYAKASFRPHGDLDVFILKELFKSSLDGFGYFVLSAFHSVIPKTNAGKGTGAANFFSTSLVITGTNSNNLELENSI